MTKLPNYRHRSHTVTRSGGARPVPKGCATPRDARLTHAITWRLH